MPMSTSSLSRRSLLFAGVGAAAATTLVGCGNNSNPSAPSSASAMASNPADVSGDISYGFWDVNQQKMLESLIEAFKKEYPNVNVSLQLTPWKDYWTKLRTQVSSKSLPDVFWINGPNFLSYAENGQLASLKPLMDAGKFDPANYPSALVEMYSLNGEPFAAPKDFDTVAIWYNKKLFDKAGVAYPDETWTLKTYQEKALELRNALKKDDIWGCAEVFSNTASYYHSIPTAGGYVLNEDKTKSGYADPKTIEGVKFWRELVESGACPDLNYLAENSAYALFESGKCAMQWSGNWRVPAMADSEVKDDVSVAYLPGGENRKTAIHGIGNVVSAHTGNLAAAQAFQAYLASEDAAQISAKSGAANPAFNGSQDEYVNAIPSFNLQVFIDQANKNAVPFPISKNTPAWQQIESEMLTQIFNGEISAEEGCPQLAERIDAELAKES